MLISHTMQEPLYIHWRTLKTQKMKIIIFFTQSILVFFNKLNRLETTLCLYLYLKPVFL